MSLVKCPHCTKPISSGALSCPHCGVDPKAPLVEERLPCRVCGATLTVGAHRVVGSYGATSTLPTTVTVVGSTATVQGGATIHERIVTVYHYPCPQCGEPKPLRRVIDIGIVDVLWKLCLGSAFALFEVCYGVWFFVFRTSADSAGHLGPGNVRVLPALAVWAAVTVAFLLSVRPYGKQTRDARYHR